MGRHLAVGLAEIATLTDLPDGRLEVRFVASGWPEIRAWVLGYGQFAELIEPEARRDELARELEATAKHYASDG